MKGKFIFSIVTAIALAMPCGAAAQFNVGNLVPGATKVVKALTLTDEQMAQYVKEYIDWMDANNPVLPESDPYTQRLRRITAGLTEADGIPLNFKVYHVIDVNAFACADGSIRVFSSLMDIMNDDELLGVIGHEIGHIAHRDSKNAFKQALLTSALRDGIAANGGTAAALTQSQLGDLGEALLSATYSKKQERNADDFGYEFLKSHGKNPRAMAMSFLRLKELQGDSARASRINQLFSTHPDLESRIKRMEERATKDGF